eukprot:13983638-Alexandrium_andersonii.AAC.1
MRHCQSRLYRWGVANGVVFDASKESVHILSSRATGPGFYTLGSDFDCKLLMSETADACAIDCA